MAEQNKKKLSGKMKASIMGGLVVASSLMNGCDSSPESKYVGTGELKSGQYTFKSENYVACTAFALDFGDEAIYSHVVPIPKSELLIHPERFRKMNHLDNVLNNSLEILKNKNIKTRDVTAHLHSGSKKDLRYLEKQLSRKDITVKRATYESETKTNEEKRRNVTYNPVSNKMTIQYVKRGLNQNGN